METAWNYTSLADYYLYRPTYATHAIEEMLQMSGVNSPDKKVCDIGAGTAHLTLMLADHGLDIVAVEPNDAMRAQGQLRTQHHKNIAWHKGTAEDTRLPAAHFDLVTFGSSFNVTNKMQALKEVERITKPNAWFVCLWNHRNLEDPIQQAIENIIKSNINGYNYGNRREDQTHILQSSGYFSEVKKIESHFTQAMPIEHVVFAWQSHATLQRQAGDKFQTIINDIQQFLKETKQDTITIPYTTRLWIAQLKN